MAPRFSGPLHSHLRIAAGVWLALLIIGSLQPARPGIVKAIHRQIHWGAFAGAAILQFSLARNPRQEILGALTILFLGISLEILQHLIFKTHMEWRDVGDDGLAILAAYALYRLTGEWKPMPDPRPQP